MSYWKFEKVASTKEMIEKLMEYEREYGVGAVTSIATVCSGDRKNEYYFEMKDTQGNNQMRIPIASITMDDLNEKQVYKTTAAQDMHNCWHDVVLNPEDMPEMNKRVLLECETYIGSHRQIWHAMGHRIDEKHFVADGCQYIPKVLAWQAITPRNR